MRLTLAAALLILAGAAGCGREDDYPYLGEDDPPTPQTSEVAPTGG